MSKSKLYFTLLITFGGIISVQQAMADAVQFSAVAVQRFPQGEPKTAQMYVGHDVIRRDFQDQNRQIIEIIKMKSGKRYVIFPQQKSYQEYNEQPMNIGLGSSKPTNTNPCTGMPGEVCTKLGTEMVFGRKADKWEVVREQRGQKIKALIWIDVERGQALRQFFPDGTVIELKQVASDTVNGRKTEKWESVLKKPNGQTNNTMQWYDPELGIIIREEIPGGYVRELTQIKVGPQPDKLFAIPNGYQKQAATDQAR
jgi:hypothetical protein